MSEGSKQGSLRRVGSLWKPKAGAKSLGTGEMTINGLKLRFVVLRNRHMVEGSRQPEYVLMSSEEPAVDEYVQRRKVSAGNGDDDVPW